MNSTFDPFVFVAECPNGHSAVFQKERAELLSSLEGQRLALQCGRCSQEWFSGPELERRLKERLRVEQFMLGSQQFA